MTDARMPDGTLGYLAKQAHRCVGPGLVPELGPRDRAVLAVASALEHLEELDHLAPEEAADPGARLADLAYQGVALRQAAHALRAERQSEADLLAGQAEERVHGTGEVPFIENAEVVLNRTDGTQVTVRLSCGAQGTRWECDGRALSAGTGIVDHLEVESALDTLARVLEENLGQSESGT
ncbi:hypothetical protein ACFYWU_40635 [Streptomyces chrestomyceticus]|uniref:hypothetical protein n=1 Tax=Streptomyces chrestomyceticus TaxID=68185 RepID=UPI0036C1B20B